MCVPVISGFKNPVIYELPVAAVITALNHGAVTETVRKLLKRDKKAAA